VRLASTRRSMDQCDVTTGKGKTNGALLAVIERWVKPVNRRVELIIGYRRWRAHTQQNLGESTVL